MHAACAASAARPPASQSVPHPASAYALLSTRQRAYAFNQPLSFDTSSVTSMHKMFDVRSSPWPAPNLQSSPPPHAACAAVARRLPPPGPHLSPHRMPSFRLSAGRVCVQSVAELRHVQCHRHGLHVLRALLPVPSPNLQSRPSLRAACAAVARRLPPSGPSTSPRTACPLSDSRQEASVFNQPLSFDTSSVTTMSGMFYVRSSPRALSPICAVEPSRGRCLPLRSPAASCLPTRIPRPAPHALLSTLGSSRRRSTSR